MKIEGKIIHVGNVGTVGKNDTKKRTFAIETDGKYPEKIGFDLLKDNVEKISASDMGKTVEVEFNIRVNEYNGKYYVSLQAWKVTFGNGTASRPMISEKQYAATLEKVKAGETKLDTILEHFELTNEQYAEIKAAQPDDDGLPF
jgi:hypothetical protein